MTGRTHDLAAFTALNILFITNPLPHITLGTAFVAFGANMIGGLTPDIDQPTGELWGRIRGGSVISRMIAPLLGGHRFISHSLLGVFLFGFVAKFILEVTSSFLIVDGTIVWWAFMIGYISHLIMDSFTRDGVPWLFPIPIHFGIPPFRALRMKTGGFLEKSVIFPLLLFTNAFIFYKYHTVFLDFLHNYIK
ncbi:MAG: metal-dependent hydrolase [Candidatus Levybacteria bacterium]|nr:metal-dependent hydrolase [Candidatus Levybacteria bacterium]